jgi:hypothetical protein
MTKSEFLALRANLLGGMNDYIRNVINLEGVTANWDISGIPADITDSELWQIAANDGEWTRICYLFGNLVAGFGN